MTGLFTELGKLAVSGGQAENQLSRTFAAAFNSSRAIREAVIPFFAAAFGLPTRQSAEDWVCLNEVRTRSGDGRLDLVLVPHAETNPHGRSAIILENKLGSPLTEAQLLKYKVDYGRVGVITSAYPEVPAGWLKAQGIPAFRWHQVHARLLKAGGAGHTQRWILNELVTYLEELGMASRGLVWKDAIAIQRTLSLVGGDVSRTGVTSLALDRLALAFAFVEDIAAAVKDMLPASTKVKMWGPGYYKEDYDEGEGVVHQLGFTLHKPSGRNSGNWLDYFLVFPQATSRPPHAWAAVALKGSEDYLDPKVWRKADLVDRRGSFQEEKHIVQVVRALRPWLRYLS